MNPGWPPSKLGSLRTSRRSKTKILFARGLISSAENLAGLINLDPSTTNVLISDENVFALHGQTLVTRLKQSGFQLNTYVVPASERSKSLDRLTILIDRILSTGIARDSVVITLGGGMVNNLGGLVASLLHRGIALVHLPSSLLAQLDAAIDDKQAVNHRTGKNLVGSIYPPRLVLIDPELLSTLPLRQLRNGIAEAIKHALTQSAEDVRTLQEEADRLTVPTFHDHLVRRTVDLKLSLMDQEANSMSEALLQYGHCIGHALEAVSDFQILHGEAISIGMTLSAEISYHLGLCSADLVETHYRIFNEYKLPTSLPAGFPLGELLKAAKRDKYCHNGRLRMALLRDVGEPVQLNNNFFIDIDPIDIAAVFETARPRLLRPSTDS